MVFAQIAVMSSHLLPGRFVEPITECTRAFLSTATPSDIIDYEEDQVCVWATLLPYLKLFYLPEENLSSHKNGSAGRLETENHVAVRQDVSVAEEADMPSSERRCHFQNLERTESCSMDNLQMEHEDYESFSTEQEPSMTLDNPLPQTSHSANHPPERNSEATTRLHSLQRVCLEMVLFFLRTKVARDCHCKVLTEEGLVDFVTCLPWHVDTAFREKAKGIVSELGGHIKLQPPKLSSLARAVLARMHFGLKKVVTVDSPMELARELMNII